MVHKKNVILEFYLRRRTEIKAYNIFIEITESQTNKQTNKKNYSVIKYSMSVKH